MPRSFVVKGTKEVGGCDLTNWSPTFFFSQDDAMINFFVVRLVFVHK